MGQTQNGEGGVTKYVISMKTGYGTEVVLLLYAINIVVENIQHANHPDTS